MTNKPALTRFLLLLATWFGCGNARKAPGTWGTLGALPFGILFLWVGGPLLVMLAAALVVMIGFYAADAYERATDTHDSGAIVIDEVAGLWITLTAATLNPLYLLLAFGLFRLFDITKPWPVSWADRQPGALGVMLDDILAGLMAAFFLWGVRLAGFG